MIHIKRKITIVNYAYDMVLITENEVEKCKMKKALQDNRLLIEPIFVIQMMTTNSRENFTNPFIHPTR